ncbi:hypothetical protein HK102_001730 [Quaeritorhiza haematococci]|nr:hypothetical protein HK102_001730 [Quaeritorhiza haematococci]
MKKAPAAITLILCVCLLSIAHASPHNETTKLFTIVSHPTAVIGKCDAPSMIRDLWAKCDNETFCTTKVQCGDVILAVSSLHQSWENRNTCFQTLVDIYTIATRKTTGTDGSDSN